MYNEMNKSENKLMNEESVKACGVNLLEQMKLLSPQLVKESIEQQQIDNERIKRQEKERLERQIFRDTEPIKEEYDKYSSYLEEQERTCKTITMDELLEMVPDYEYEENKYDLNVDLLNHPVKDFVLQCNYPSL